MAELRGKGWRVLGFFVWMVSAGLYMESDAQALGTLGLACGAGLFFLGAWQSLGSPGEDRP